MKEVIGIDIGTTASKGVLYDEAGNQLAQLSQAYPLIQDHVDQAEEDPKVIFAAVQHILFELAKIAKRKGTLAAISWSAQMHSLIGLNENFEPLSNSFTWADNRAQNYVANNNQIYLKTGLPNHPMGPIYKLRWLKQKNPQLYQQVKYWVGIKEYIIARLTGQLKEDMTLAAGTGLLNMHTLSWDADLLKSLTLKPDQLPDLAMPDEIAGYLTPEYSQKLGIGTEVPIIMGASDGYLSTIGVGVLDHNEFALNVGTSGAVRTLVPQPLTDKNGKFFSYASPNKQYLIGGPVNNGGIVFAWAKNTLFGPNAAAEDYLAAAETVPAGSNGLLFHPYLGGERAPIWNPAARGSFIGLTRNHTQPQMARSVLEGIVYNLAGVGQTLREQVGQPDTLRITGGFVKSELIRQMLADVFELPVQTMKQEQGGSIGAFFLAGLALGWFHDFADIKEFAQPDKTYYPKAQNVHIYQELLQLYREIEKDLEPTYLQLAKWQENHPQK
ncbi:gluconokinase [Lactobacillus sp. PV034]|uniref:gluconokinase n=1 Tax=Lactobacillus sp. PV034 TaxID=2594495 RepID=UPI002240DED5|nr:gluconokinase [Lactobacillus sp. PV034]QNQ81405.1 gluconate kinase [Lactobacillus sp. PV034]